MVLRVVVSSGYDTSRINEVERLALRGTDGTEDRLEADLDKFSCRLSR